MLMEFRLLWRSAALRWAVLAATMLTTLALALGIVNVAALERAAERAVATSEAALANQRLAAASTPLDTGMFAYGTFFTVPMPPAPGAWFNPGDTLAQAPAQRIRMLGLQGQAHDGTGGNPAALAAGAFDAAFVIAVLLPLLAVALLAPLAAEEREARRDGLLAALVVSPRRFWLQRIAARGLLVLAPVMVPIAIALAVIGASPAFALGVLGGSLLYGIAWIALFAALALRSRGGSDAVAARLLALWALAVLVLPTVGGLLLDRIAPTVPGSAIALAHRQAVNDAWDQPKRDTFEAFFEAHPEWRATPEVTGRFHWKWYFAFHHVADRRVEPLLAEAKASREVRQQARSALGLMLPTVALQNLFDGLSDQGLEGGDARAAAARHFHDRLRRAMYPYLFEERPLSAGDLDTLPRPQAAQRSLRHRPAAWGALAGFALLGLGLLWRASRRLS